MIKFIENILYKPFFFNEEEKPKVVKRTKSEIEDDTSEGKYVYHVANPDVKGTVCQSLSGEHCEVWFEIPVGFSGNPQSGKRSLWVCSKKLLFPTPELARLNHNPNYKD